MKGKAVLPPEVERDNAAEVPVGQERGLVELAQNSAERAKRLLGVMTALGEPSSARDVAELVGRELPEALGAISGLVALVTAERTHFEILSSFGIGALDRERFGTFTKRYPAIVFALASICVHRRSVKKRWSSVGKVEAVIGAPLRPMRR